MSPGIDKVVLYGVTIATLFGAMGLTYCRKNKLIEPIDLSEGDNRSLFGFGGSSKKTGK